MSDSDHKTVGEAIVELLEAYGIDTVFGIPGTHSIELYRGLANSKIRHISPRHEQGGGFMADGYARLSGRPAACFVITGAGVTNLATAMGQAYSDSTPMLVISPVNPPAENGHNIGRLHEIADQTTVTQDLAGFSEIATDQESLKDLICEAFTVFASERPLPCHIHVPLPLFKEAAAGSWAVRNIPGPPQAEDADLAAAAEMINSAERPIIIAGGGIVRSTDAVVEIAEGLNIPVISTTNAKGVLPLDHPLYLGTTLTTPATQDLLASCDLLIALGTEMANTDYWCETMPLPERKVVVNLDDQLLERQGATSLGIKADAADTARKFAALAKRRETNPLQVDFDTTRAANAAAVAPETAQIHRAVLEAIREALPEDSSVFTDMTQIAYTGNVAYPSSMFGNWFHPIGYGTLGYGLPAALGAKLAERDRAVVALVGDAGFQYTMQEMALAEELGVPLIVIMWNNEALQQIADDMSDAGITKVGVVQKNPDFQALAKAYRWNSAHAATLDALTAAITTALAADGPSFIEVRDPEIRASVAG
ncbi:MAG: 5-guanidino-2-oxopentanoate decarboxylase [Alphaproteobacteria bacterium]|nr:5-guanidino-2-oxopentanoate decarboxylase [Alphaproteobacteria bacterium]